MGKSIAIISTLDTKGDQTEYIMNLIEKKGHKSVVIDVGVLGDVPFEPAISRHQVAEAAGKPLEEIADLGALKELEAMEYMTDGVRKLLLDLNKEGRIDGALCLGGSMGTSLSLEAMMVLPISMPKVILSTVANSPAINPDYYSANIIMMPWIGGLWGFNDMAKMVLDQAVGMVVGMAEAYERKPKREKKLIGITSLGMTAARYLFHLRPALVEKGYDSAVFHATGMNTRIFEKAAEEGEFDFVLDLQAGVELNNEIYGSAFSPGEQRMEGVAKSGVPQIVSLGIVEQLFWGGDSELPRKYEDRFKYKHNPLLWVVLTNGEEKIKMAHRFVEKLNKTTGPTSVIMPLGTPMVVKMMGVEDLETQEAIRKILKNGLKSEINYVEVDASTDDEKFSNELLALMDKMME